MLSDTVDPAAAVATVGGASDVAVVVILVLRAVAPLIPDQALLGRTAAGGTRSRDGPNHRPRSVRAGLEPVHTDLEWLGWRTQATIDGMSLR
ncbi:MAG: hypothetical protein H7Y15_01190 [Pseudonocardia sp.]|nr:hypothetical protein [Pseudonocardia sp.]